MEVIYPALEGVQANIVSNVVGNLGVMALDSDTKYKRPSSVIDREQRFPDLRGPEKEPLESKGALNFNTPNAHNKKEGWFIVWRYIIDSQHELDGARTVKIFRVDVAYLLEDDWKYLDRGPKSQRTPNTVIQASGMKKFQSPYLDPRVTRKGRGFVIIKPDEKLS